MSSMQKCAQPGLVLCRLFWSRPLSWAGLVFLSVALCFYLVRPTKPVAPECSRSSMVLVDGRLRLGGQTNTFSGIMVERFPDGSYKSRSSIAVGLLHGLSEGWHTNGHKQVAEHFTNGIAHGLRTKWDENGKLLSQTMIVAGNLDGVFRRWFPNGTLSEQIEMKNGQPHGLSQAFYPSGFLKAEVRLRHGHVTESRFWDDGQQMPALQSLAIVSGEASR
jgi:antitoxin component YwqK of YwqJK toxin-antitoxin module